MSDKLNTLEALRLASLKAKGYTAEQIAELSSAMEDIIKDINDSLKTCEDHVQSAHAPANAEENVIVSIQRNGQAIPPDNKVVNIEVPTKTSALENDSGYATTEDVEEKVNGAGHLKAVPVDALPAPSEANADTIYFLRKNNSEAGKQYRAYKLIHGVFEIVGSAEVDLTGYATQESVAKADDNLIKGIRDIGILFGYKVDQASEQKVEGSIKSLKSMASKVLGAVGITLSVAGIKSAVDGCVEVASSVEEMQNKFDVVFGDMRDEVNKWAQEYSDAIGRNKDDIKTYLADQQNLLVGFGMTRQAGAEMAEQMTSLALDLASFGNMDETTSVNAMTKAVMGESEAAKTLGAVLNDSTRAQAMATLGLKGTYDKLDQLTKMQVNYQAILQQSPDAIGDCKRSLDSYESTKKRYIAKLKEIKTIIGQFFLPTYQKILSIGAKGLTMIRDWLQKLTDLTDKLGGSQRVLSVLAAAFTAMLVAMNLKKIGAAINGFTKLARAIGLGHGKALAFFAVFLLLALVIEDFISFMRGDKSLLGTMLERAGVDCEKLRQNIVGVWTKIKQAIGYIGEGIRNVVVPIFEGIRTAAVVAFEEIQKAVAKVAPGIAQFFKELSSGKVDKKKWIDIGESIGRIAVGVVAVIAAVKGISAIFGVITTVISVVKAVISVIKLAFVVVTRTTKTGAGRSSPWARKRPVSSGSIWSIAARRSRTSASCWRTPAMAAGLRQRTSMARP